MARIQGYQDGSNRESELLGCASMNTQSPRSPRCISHWIVSEHPDSWPAFDRSLGCSDDSRIWIDFIQETAPVLLIENSRKAIRLVLKWLYVLDVEFEDISRLGTFDLKGTGEVVDLCQVHVLHIIGAIVVANLSSCPVHALDLNAFAVFDLSSERD
jgi:hypothetical protein